MNGSNGNAVNSGNDLIVGVVGTGATLQGTDMIDGGEGTDTLRIISDKTGAITELNVVSNVEIIELRSSTADTIDTTVLDGVTNLNIASATGASIGATAADTTDISVTGAKGAITIAGGKNIVVNDATADKAITIGATTGAAGTITVTDTKQGTGNIAVDGGTDVTITATTNATAAVTGGTIKVGLDGTPIAPTGAVTITQNLNSDGVGGDLDGGDISVTGGTSVDITVNATSKAKDENADNDITIGTVTVTGDSKTTDVTVTQNASVTTFTKAGTAEVAEKDTVTFKAMAKGDTLTTSGSGSLVFTAAKALTAEQVAAAFANLVNDDTQSATGPTANGFFTGTFSSVWSSAAASGATVVFTANSAAGAAVTWTHSNVANNPTVVNTSGTALVSDDTSTNTVTLGNVVVDDDATAAIKTITLNGFSDATLGAGGSLDALTTLNLTNSSGDTKLTSTSTTLALNANGITNAGGKVVDLSTAGAVETLTITTTGAASDIDLTAEAVKSLTIDAGVALTLQNGTNYDGALETVTIKGAGAVDLDDISAATKLKSFSAADNTGGVTATISAKTADLDTTFTKYVFSKGDDVVTMDEKEINKAIELGEGNDSIALKVGVRIADVTANIDGGAGDADTLILQAADAQALSADTAFNAKISGFERLTIGNAASQEVVDLTNLDGISYVTLGSSAGTKQASNVTPSGTIEVGDIFKVSVNGTEYSFTATGTTVQNVVEGLKAKIDADTAAVVVATEDDLKLTLTSVVAGVPFEVIASDANKVGGSDDTQALTLAVPDPTPNAYGITLNNLANNGTVVLTDLGSVAVNIKDAATGDADVLNIITNGASDDMVYLQADDVETIHISATETYTLTAGELVANGDERILVLAADSATSVVVGGEGALDLTLFNSDLVELVDASTNKGGLTFTASLADLVVQGGTGADDLTANADDVALYGGAGNDTLTVDGGLRVNLYGGEGADTFEINASTSLDAYTVINGVDSGDVIMLNGANKFSAAKIALSLGADESLLNYANQAIKTLAEGEMGWFQRGGNTFIVQDVAHVPSGGSTNADAFTAGEDMIVMIVGLVDLGTGASYNTSNILEIV